MGFGVFLYRFAHECLERLGPRYVRLTSVGVPVLYEDLVGVELCGLPRLGDVRSWEGHAHVWSAIGDEGEALDGFSECLEVVECVGALALGLGAHFHHEFTDGLEQLLQGVHRGLLARRDALDDASLGVERVGEQRRGVGDLGLVEGARRGRQRLEGTGEDLVEGGDGGVDCTGRRRRLGGGPLRGRGRAGLRLETRGDSLQPRHERLHVHGHLRSRCSQTFSKSP